MQEGEEFGNHLIHPFRSQGIVRSEVGRILWALKSWRLWAKDGEEKYELNAKVLKEGGNIMEDDREGWYIFTIWLIYSCKKIAIENLLY